MSANPVAPSVLSDLIEIPAGTLRMGSTEHYPEEAPLVTLEVAAFRLEQHPVTNAQFTAFVQATGYVTVAERSLEGPVYAHLSEADRQPGSLVFTGTTGPVALNDHTQWWSWVSGASWRLPAGPGSRARPKAQHPVVHVSHEDTLAYAEWAGRRLPTEAEHEWAARGGVGIVDDGAWSEYSWGSELTPGGELQANTWQGEFPHRNRGARGFKGTSAVGTFALNGYGLADMIGNVWEWTGTEWSPDHRALSEQIIAAGRVSLPMAQAAPHAHAGGQQAPCCGGSAPLPGQRQFVAKGGSHLCAPEYCLRYRPAARIPQTQDSATSHMGFRLALS